jgi:hypothetical protein
MMIVVDWRMVLGQYPSVTSRRDSKGVRGLYL